MRDQVAVVVDVGVMKLAKGARLVQRALENETLEELEVGIAVEIHAPGSVHLRIVFVYAPRQKRHALVYWLGSKVFAVLCIRLRFNVRNYFSSPAVLYLEVVN